MHNIQAERIDFARIEPRHYAIDARLENWGRYVKDRGASWMSPIWRLGKPMGRHWNVPEPKTVVDANDAMKIEHSVSILPEPHRTAIRWAYVYRSSPARQARALGVRYDTLARLVVDARQMLIQGNYHQHPDKTQCL